MALGLLASASPGGLAAPDARAIAWGEQVGAALRWDPVTRDPYWISEAGASGLAAQLGLDTGRVRLGPGESVHLWLPAHERLRLAPQEETPPPKIRVAQTPGLWAAYRPTAGPEDMLLVAPDATGPLVVELANPAREGPDLVFRAWISRTLQPESAPYPEPLALPGPKRHLRVAGHLETRPVSALEPGMPLEQVVRGPARVALRVFPRYEQAPATTRAVHRLELRLDGDPATDWLLEAGVQPDTPRYVDGRPRSLGVGETVYLEVPAGDHRLGIESSHPAYVHARRSRGRGDMLLPGLNAPRGLDRCYAETDLPPTLEHPPGAELRTVCAERRPETVIRRALALARDNRAEDSGLAAAAVLQRAARAHPGAAPALRAAAERVRMRYTQWTDLFPLGLDAPGHFVWYRISPLNDDPSHEPKRLLDTHFLAVQRTRRPRAMFTPLAPGQRLVFAPHASRILGELQLLVQPAADTAATLELTLDGGEPLELQLDPASSSMPARYWGVGRTEALAAWLEATEPWAPPALPAFRYRVALPAGTERVTIALRPGSAPVAVALQQRRGRTARLGEDAYMDALARIGGASAGRRLFGAALHHADILLDPGRQGAATPILDAAGVVPEARPAAALLLDDWLPLIRQLWHAAAQWRWNLPEALPAASGQPGGQLTEALAAARTATAGEDSLETLARWRRVLDLAPTGDPARDEAVLHMAGLLERRGEPYLAERLRRLLLLHGSTPDRRLEAYHALLQGYRRQGRGAALDGLLATALMHLEAASETVLQDAVERWYAAGRDDAALQMQALLDSPSTDPEYTAAMALRTGWPERFQLALKALDATRAARWRARLLAASGHREEAEAAAREARLPEAPLFGETAGSCADTVLRARWLWQPAGPRRWRAVTETLVPTAVWRRIESRVTGTGGNAVLLTGDEPLRFEIHGPAILRLELRPLHPDTPDPDPVSGWFQVKEVNGAHWVHPFDDNRPASGLAPLPEGRPGAAITGDLRLTPGRHRLEVDTGGVPALLRIHAWLPTAGAGLVTLPPAAPASVPPTGLTCTRVDAVHIQCRRRATLDDPVEPQRAATCPAPPADGALPEPRDLQPMTRVHGGGTTAYERVVRIRWRLARDRSTPAAAVAEVARLAHEHGDDLRLQAVARPLLRHARWRPLEPIVGSAGVRRIELPAWTDAAPALRVRSLLLEGACSRQARLVTSGQALVFLLRLPEPRTVSVQLHACAALTEPVRPIPFTLWVDGQVRKTLRAAPGASPTTVQLRLPAGATSLALRLAEAAPNTYLGVRLDVPGHSQTDTIRRSFHLATRREPLLAFVDGPAWLRLDCMEHGRLQTRYRWIEPGLQELRLAPPSGEDELLCRAYRLEWRDTPRPAPLREPPPVPETTSPWPQGLSLSAALPGVGDDLPLDRQGLGTPGLHLAWVDRLEPDEAERNRLGGERFLELRGLYRYRDRFRDRGLRLTALGRIREHGGPTFGLKGLYRWRPVEDWPDFHLVARLSGFLQDPGRTRQGGAGTLESAFTLRTRAVLEHRLGPRTVHLPRLELFGRVLSLDADQTRYHRRDLDRDVFTRYKAEHRYGWKLADTLRHRPWLDTLWEAGIALVSNETLDPTRPDHWEGRLRWRQRLGAFELGLGYRLRRYLADEDRDDGFFDHRLRLSAAGEHWSLRQQRFFWSLSVEYDVDSGDTGLRFTLGWSGGAGRGLRDYLPGEHAFPGLAEIQMPHDTNRIGP